MNYYPDSSPDAAVDMESGTSADKKAADRPLWQVNALRGEVQESGDRIQLSGKVNVTGPMPSAAQTVSLDTEMLFIQPREERITTDGPVILTWSGQRLSAVGMIADLKGETVQLQSKVNGRFIP